MPLSTPSRLRPGAIAAAVVSAAALLACGPSAASAATVSRTWTDSCALNLGGNAVTIPASVSYTATVPDTVTRGGSYAVTGVRQTLTFSAAAVKQLAAYGSGLQLRADDMRVTTGRSGSPSETDLIPTGTTVLSNRAAFQTDVWNPFDASKTTYKPLSITLAPPASATFSHRLGITDLVELNAQDGLSGTFLLDGLFGQTGYSAACSGPRTSLASYTAAPPVAAGVVQITPLSGPVTGGNEVTVRGPGLEGAIVRFGLVAATTVRSDGRSLVVRAPARSTPGPVSMTVSVNGLAVPIPAASQVYTYTAVPAPTITSLSPASAPEWFGTRIVASGANLSGATAVTFNGQSVPFSLGSGTVAFDAPGLPKGTYTVAIVTPGGSATRTFTYTAWF